MLSRLALIGLFGAIGWPWLLRGNLPADPRQRARLLTRLNLSDSAFPALNGWAADADFLALVADRILENGARTIVEFGSGASTVAAARALELAGGGELISIDTHETFADATRGQLARLRLHAEVRTARLRLDGGTWGGRWEALGALPERIDLLIVDGPPWFRHPFIRGSAEMLFDRVAPGGAVLLDDAARPGERVVAARWRRRWPQFDFRACSTAKGALLGERRR